MRLALAAGGTAALLVTSPALGAQVYVQPLAFVETQTSSNVELETDPAEQQQVEGYFADAALVLGIATPRSDTTLRPRVMYRYYPDNTDLNRLEAYADLSTRYDTQRGHLKVFGRYEHRDEVQAERSGAEFNDITPASPTTPETGRVRVGATRDMGILVPSYLFDVSQRMAVGASAILQTLDYSPDDTTSHIDFSYYQGKGLLQFDLTQRVDLTLGAYGSKYEATHIDSETDSYGVSTDVDVNWSQVLDSRVTLAYQHSDIARTEPTVFEDSADGWAASVATNYRGPSSRVTFSLGRTITPSGAGGLYNSDSIRLQYRKSLTSRVELMTAARYLRNRALSADIGDNDRDYTRAELSMKWKLSPTWYVEAGYEYTWQEYENDPSSAADHSFALRFGYEGLPRQR